MDVLGLLSVHCPIEFVVVLLLFEYTVTPSIGNPEIEFTVPEYCPEKIRLGRTNDVCRINELILRV